MKHERIPTWLLERVAAGEVPPEHADEVRQILDRDPAERARLAELERSNEEILAALPPALVAAEVTRRAAVAEPGAGWLARAASLRRDHGPNRAPVRRRMLAWSSSLAACAGAVLLVMVVGRQVGWLGPDTARDGAGAGDQVASGDVTRVKGDERQPRLLLFRKRGDKAQLLDLKSDLARAGDNIQISYRTVARAAHGVILSIDGAGAVNLHFPVQATGSTLLEQSQAARLSYAYELDDAPGFERFLFLTSASPIDVAAVMAAAEKLARDPLRAARDTLPLTGTLEQRWYTLRKEAAP
jgi:hypothetical protein